MVFAPADIYMKKKSLEVGKFNSFNDQYILHNVLLCLNKFLEVQNY